MATTTKTTHPAAELVPIAEQLQAAREERARLDAEARTWQDEVGKLERDLAGLACDDPAQFANGFPRPKTKAARLRTEIDKRVNGNRWSDIIGGAERRVQELEHDLSRRTEANADALARDEYLGRGSQRREVAADRGPDPRGRERIQSLGRCPPGNRRHRHGTGRPERILDPVIEEARKLAERLAEVQPPRAAALVPLTTEDPVRVKSIHGGYIRAGAAAADIAEDQPERVEPV